MARRRILTILGTRPEAIKLAPVIMQLRRHSAQLETLICATGQHTTMLDQALADFKLAPDVRLDLENSGDLAGFAAAALVALAALLARLRPDAVVVQGDTTSALMGAQAAFYQRVPVAHVEAGLRSALRYEPFPEELHRRLISALATWHFAPTCAAVKALAAEGLTANVYLTGNTVIDALHMALGCAAPAPPPHGPQPRTILVTMHRRENLGAPLADVCLALAELARQHADLQIVFPVHPNPAVRDTVYSLLGGCPRIVLCPPLPYPAFAALLSRAYLVITDSGGIQEEAAALGRPALIVRRETERREVVDSGVALLAASAPVALLAEVERLLLDQRRYGAMARPLALYGNGDAARKIVEILLGELCPEAATMDAQSRVSPASAGPRSGAEERSAVKGSTG